MDSSSSTVALVVPSSSGPPEDDGGEMIIRMKKYLTLDSIIEIFSRLPVKSLLRFKCISKFWYSLIQSPNFISMHSTHSHRNSKIVSLLRGSCRQTFSFTNPGITTFSFRIGDHLEQQQEEKLTLSGVLVIQDVKMVGCCNGTVCISLSQDPQMYVLWNPATKQAKRIDGPLRDGPIHITGVWYGSVLCFDLVTNVFKVVQIKFTFPDATGEIRAQVNVFSTTTNSWTNKNMVLPSGILAIGLLPVGNATFVNGYIYWHLGWALQDTYILSYNMSDEVFHRIEMPSSPAFVHYPLTAYKGSLAVFVNEQTGSTDVDVWVLSDCSGGNQAWSKILTCKPSIKVTRFLGFFRKNGLDYILMYSAPDNSYYLYDPENGETNKFLIRESTMGTFPYSESLVPLS